MTAPKRIYAVWSDIDRHTDFCNSLFHAEAKRRGLDMALPGNAPYKIAEYWLNPRPPSQEEVDGALAKVEGYRK